MARAPALRVIAWLVGCSGWFAPPVTHLQGGGLAVDLPDGFVALDERVRTERLAEAQATAPEQEHSLVGAQRGPRGAGGLVQLQRSIEADPGRYGATVGAVLERLRAELRAQTGGEDRPRDGGWEVCATATDEGTVRRTCALLTVEGEPRPHLVVRAVTCTAPEASICEQVLASRRYAVTGALAETVGLVAPGDLPRWGTDVWGFELGSSREVFRTACRAAGHRVDAYDWSTQPPVVREWYDAGRTSRCEGLPVAPRLGTARAVSAVFDEDQLVGLTLFLAGSVAEVGPQLAERYPISVQGRDQVLHVIDPEAEGDSLQSVTLLGTGDEPARITFLSERGSRGR